jgi:hypothetical protein
VYHVKKEPVEPFMILKDGWNQLEEMNGNPTRWMSNNATIIIHSDSTRNAVLKFDACSFYRPRTLEIYNGKTLKNIQISTTNITSNYVPISLEKGENLIFLHVPEGSERPCDIPALKNIDSRELSIAIQGVRLIFY